jgi:peptidoglycan/LPS O-acetylase OafA/YrhL
VKSACTGVGGSGPPLVLTYRADIDGLRAVSVLLVLVFHMSSSFMPGGFVGVDVFFVISGYLISQLLFRSLQNGQFSFVDFYVRRIRRIVPALFCMIVFTIALACFMLMPGVLRELARSGIYAIVGGSNFYFLHNTGYFDLAAEQLPLLHTWSLGVEEQFYLVWPLFLLLLFEMTGGKRGWMAAGVGLVAVGSFCSEYSGCCGEPEARVLFAIYAGLGAWGRCIAGLSSCSRRIRLGTSSCERIASVRRRFRSGCRF